MKWRSLPIWLKVLIIIVFVFLIAASIDYLVNYWKGNKQKLYRKWLETKKELAELNVEKRKLLKGVAIARYLAKLTLGAIKLIVVLLMVAFVYTLIYGWDYDFIGAVAVAGGFCWALRALCCLVLKNKLMKLDQIEQFVTIKLRKMYLKKLKVNPDKLIEINNRVSELETIASEIKLKLHQN